MQLSDFKSSIIERARTIRWLILDVDGVLTDGSLLFTNNGDEIKAFNSLDGHGLKMLRHSGVETAIITGRTSDIVAHRAKNLGITCLMQGREDKLNALEELREKYPVAMTDIAYMGDDLPDLPLIRRVGLGMTPTNGHWTIKQHAHWQSQYAGGQGAVRQACDLIMLAQGSLDHSITYYL